MEKLLEVTNLNGGYGKVQILWNISLHLAPAEFVALLGPNGAGKTTTLRAIAGLVHPKSGDIRFREQSLAGLKPSAISRNGIRLISEESNLFGGMSVEENLLLGAYGASSSDQIRLRLDFVFGLFPVVRERRKQLAGTLSGGERKMLGISRALMSGPKLLLVDEPSLGLAPKLVSPLFAAFLTLNQQGVAILLVEQNVATTLEITTRAYVLEQGRIVLEGPSRDLLHNTHVRKSYLGVI